MRNQPPIEAFVLVGGKSRRMGRDKARLELDGMALVVRAANLLAPFVDKVTLLGPVERYGDLDLPVLPDVSPDQGPLGALCTGLLHSKSDWNVFLACDLPLLSERVIRLLISRTTTSRSDALVPRTADGWQPLCAAYHSHCLGAFQAALQNGKLGLQDLLRGLDAEALTSDELAAEGIREQEFANINTPEEWNQVKSRLEPRR